jgi:hypothetical protein
MQLLASQPACVPVCLPAWPSRHLFPHRLQDRRKADKNAKWGTRAPTREMAQEAQAVAAHMSKSARLTDALKTPGFALTLGPSRPMEMMPPQQQQSAAPPPRPPALPSQDAMAAQAAAAAAANGGALRPGARTGGAPPSSTSTNKSAAQLLKERIMAGAKRGAAAEPIPAAEEEEAAAAAVGEPKKEDDDGAAVKAEVDGSPESPARKKRRSAGASPTPEGAASPAAEAAEAAVAEAKVDAAGLWEQLEVKKEEDGSDDMETNSQGAPLLLPPLVPPLMMLAIVCLIEQRNSVLLPQPAAC